MQRGKSRILAFVVASALSAGVAAAVPAVSEAFELVNVHSDKCLENYDWGTTNATRVDQWTCDGGQNQQWYIFHTLSGARTLVNGWGSNCLEIYDWGLNDGNLADTWQCDAGAGGANQEWYIINEGSGQWRLENVYSTFSLEVRGSSTANGAIVDQYEWYPGHANQVWYEIGCNTDCS